MAAAAPTINTTPLDDYQQRQLIALELNLVGDVPFEQFLALVWQQYAAYATISYQLRFLIVKKHAIQYLMGQVRLERDWSFADVKQSGSQLIKNLDTMLKAVQTEIDDTIGKAITRTAKVGDLAVGQLVIASSGSPFLLPGQPAAAAGTATVTTTPAGTTAGTSGGVTTTLSTGSKQVDWSSQILEAGFSQPVMPANFARDYLLLVNTSGRSLWWQRGTSATMGDPSSLIAAGQSVLLTGDVAPTDAISIIGATTGSTFQATERFPAG